MNRKGFTLAELLVSLLIIGIVVSVSTPILVREKVSQPEQIWHWTGNNNAIYFGINDNQQVIINHTGNEELNGKFIIKPLSFNAISFYSHPGNVAVAEHKPVLGINYGGRISADDKNIAFGIGALQNSGIEYNTAIGHFSQNNLGQSQKDNTSVGFSALMSLNNGSRNTAVGYDAGRNFSQGDDNVIIGYNAASEAGSDLYKNTIIGAYACQTSGMTDFRGNICIGYNASGNLGVTGENQIFIGSDNVNYNESTQSFDSSEYTPLISGHTDFDFESENPLYDKEIEFNTRKLSVKSDDGEKSMFDFTTSRGTSGYDIDSNIIKGETISKYYYSPTDGADYYTGIKTYVDNSAPEVLKMDMQTYSDGYQETDFNINFIEKGSGVSYPVLNLNLAPHGELSLSSSQKSSLFSFTSFGGSGSKMIFSSSSMGSYGSGVFLSRYSITEPFNIVTKNALGFDAEVLDFVGKGISLSSQGKINMGPPAPEPGTIDDVASSFAAGFYAGEIGVYSNSSDTTPKIAFNPDEPSLSIGARKIIWLTGDSAHFYTVSLKSAGTVSQIISQTEMEIYYKSYKCSACSYPSDIRLKNVSGDNESGLEEINKLNVKNYTFKSDEKKEPRVGVIAQELQKVFPNSVFEGKDGYLKIKTEEMFYAAVNSIKQLHLMLRKIAIKITGLEKRINSLEKENKKLKKKNEELEKRFKKLEAQKSNKK